MICPAYHLVSWPTLPEDAQGQEEKNSELLDTSKNSFLYDDCLLINKIAIWKSSGIAFLIHWATLASKTALVSDAYAGLVSRDRSSVKKLRFLNLRQYFKTLLSIVLRLGPEMLLKHKKLIFPPAFPDLSVTMTFTCHCRWLILVCKISSCL